MDAIAIMEDAYVESFWKSFAAAIDMLKQAVIVCPANLWQDDQKFFYLSYHTTIFLDYYLTNPVKDFIPVLPYTITDSSRLPAGAIDDVIPNKLYSKQEMVSYLYVIREKCRKRITRSVADKGTKRWIEDFEIDLHGLCPPLVIHYSILDILFYNFRHLQHHVGQLNYMLRQSTNSAPDWIAIAD